MKKICICEPKDEASGQGGWESDCPVHGEAQPVSAGAEPSCKHCGRVKAEHYTENATCGGGWGLRDTHFEAAQSLPAQTVNQEMLAALRAAKDELHEMALSQKYNNPPRNPELTAAAQVSPPQASIPVDNSLPRDRYPGGQNWNGEVAPVSPEPLQDESGKAEGCLCRGGTVNPDCPYTEREAQPVSARTEPPERFDELVNWLENEAEERMKNAIGRRSTAKTMRNATTAELREAKALAEKMHGHKLHGVSATTESAKSGAEMDDRIAAKYEAEARRLSGWADMLRAAQSLSAANRRNEDVASIGKAQP